MRARIADTLADWDSIREYLDALAGGWVFRGQRDASWGLASTLDRAATRLSKKTAEDIVNRGFTRSMHDYIDASFVPANELEILSLMQHHGAPTRLLDFTRSAYVAAFFAVESAVDEAGSCAIWAIEQSWCKANAMHAVRAELGPTDPALAEIKFQLTTLEPDLFRRVFFGPVSPNIVLPVEPYRRNQRLTVQQGLFLCPGNVNAGFEGNLSAYDADSPERHVVKVVIPNKLRAFILSELKYMNITRASLLGADTGLHRCRRLNSVDSAG
jgi:hypothetical protein